MRTDGLRPHYAVDERKFAIDAVASREGDHENGVDFRDQQHGAEDDGCAYVTWTWDGAAPVVSSGSGRGGAPYRWSYCW